MKRKPMSNRTSRKSFRKGNKVHPKNSIQSPIMRGGIRF